MSTFLRDYPHADDETMRAASRAALNGRRPDVVSAASMPQGWQPARILVGVAAIAASMMTLLAGAFYLGWLIYGQPDTGNPAIDDSAAYWGEIMSHSAYGVIGIFGGVLGLTIIAGCAWVGWTIRRATYVLVAIILGQSGRAVDAPEGGKVIAMPDAETMALARRFARHVIRAERRRAGDTGGDTDGL